MTHRQSGIGGEQGCNEFMVLGLDCEFCSKELCTEHRQAESREMPVLCSDLEACEKSALSLLSRAEWWWMLACARPTQHTASAIQ